MNLTLWDGEIGFSWFGQAIIINSIDFGLIVRVIIKILEQNATGVFVCFLFSPGLTLLVLLKHDTYVHSHVI